jgi:ankyrin repeat protein
MNLIQAAQKGLYSEVEAAIARHESLEMADPAGFTALHWAAMRGYSDIIELLVAKGAKIDHPATRQKLTPLHMAAIANRKEALEKLLELGADKEAKNEHGDTPLAIAIRVNACSDWIKIEGQDLPVVSIVNQLGSGFDAIFELLMHGAHVPDKDQLGPVAISAIIHDRADVLGVLMEHGFDYQSINDEDSLVAGFEYAGLLASSNFAINCLKRLLEANPKILQPSLIGQLINSNMFIWMIQQLPDREILTAPALFFEAQEGKNLRKEDLDKLLPTCLRSCDVSYAFDERKEPRGRFYISKVMYGLCALYFDKNGQLENQGDVLQKLRATIELLLSQGMKLNHQDVTGDTPAKFLVRCPEVLIQVFRDYGIRFSGEDLHRAIGIGSPRTVELVLESGAPVNAKNKEGDDAMAALMKTNNDELLNDRPRLLELMRKKASTLTGLEEQLSELNITARNETTDLSELFSRVMTSQFDSSASSTTSTSKKDKDPATVGTQRHPAFS